MHATAQRFVYFLKTSDVAFETGLAVVLGAAIWAALNPDFAMVGWGDSVVLLLVFMALSAATTWVYQTTAYPIAAYPAMMTKCAGIFGCLWLAIRFITDELHYNNPLIDYSVYMVGAGALLGFWLAHRVNKEAVSEQFEEIKFQLYSRLPRPVQTVFDGLARRGVYTVLDFCGGIGSGLILLLSLQSVFGLSLPQWPIPGELLVILLCGIFFLYAGTSQRRPAVFLTDIIFGAAGGFFACLPLKALAEVYNHPHLFDHAELVLISLGVILKLRHTYKARHPGPKTVWYDALGFDTMGSFFSWCVSAVTYAVIAVKTAFAYRQAMPIILGIDALLLLYIAAAGLTYLKTRAVTPWIARANLIARVGIGVAILTAAADTLYENEHPSYFLPYYISIAFYALIAFCATGSAALFVSYKHSRNWLFSFGHTVGLGCGIGALLGIAGRMAYAAYTFGSIDSETRFIARDAGLGALAGFAIVYFLRHDVRVVLMPLAVISIKIYEIGKTLFVIALNTIVCGGIAYWLYVGQNAGASKYNLFHPIDIGDWVFSAGFGIFAFAAVAGAIIGLAQIAEHLTINRSPKLPKPRGGSRKFAAESD